MCFLPIIFAKSVTQPLDWGVGISLFSLAISVVVTVIILILKKKSRVEEELRREQFKSLGKDISSVVDKCERIELQLKAIENEFKSHSSACATKFVLKDVYSEVLRAQREEVQDIKKVIDQQSSIIEKLR